MAENTDKILCSICLNDFKQPKILVCKHSFCLICLEGYIQKVTIDNQFPCPLCRRDITLPDDGVKGFDTNNQLEEEKVPKCDACKSDISSGFRCEDCHQYLCSTCRKCHDNLTGTRNHVVVEYNKSLENVTRDNPGLWKPSGDHAKQRKKDFCSIHHDRMADYYCKQCMVGVCCRCFVENHNGHSFVDVLDEKVRGETRDELNTLKGSLETQAKDFQNYSDSLKRTITDINQSSKVSCRNVDKQVKKICYRIKKLGEDLKEKIQKSRQDEGKKCAQKLEELKTLIENIEARIKCTENILADDSTVEELKRISQAKKEKEETSIQPLKLPVVTYAWFEEEIIDDRILEDQLGVLKNFDGPTFRSSFKVDEQKMLGKGLTGDDYYIQGIPCHIKVTKTEINEDPFLCIDLCIDIRKDSNVKSWKVKTSDKLNNWNNKQYAIEKTDNTGCVFTANVRTWGRDSFIDWKRFVNIQNGFVDTDRIFSVQVTFNRVESERY